MGWAVGYDDFLDRDVGYGVPAICDDPSCSKEIHRGLAYVCGGEPYGGDHGCGLHFCSSHLWIGRGRRGEVQVCRRCKDYRKPYKPKPDTAEWIQHKLTDPSWEQWRRENPKWVDAQGIEARSDGTQSGPAEGESPVGHQADASNLKHKAQSTEQESAA